MPTLMKLKCPTCSRSMLTKSMYFMTLPRVLMLHLKRVSVIDGETKKLHDSISIPEELTLQGFCEDTVQPGTRVTSLGKNDVDITPVNSESPDRYCVQIVKCDLNSGTAALYRPRHR
ncbi:hypothetical protein DPEC_G00166780 [Dallia pectoralis]|uniref:Uncharacterized protein n=1 Tax=Dallia pectoralis TaxID=75939 RepID=A0ACC2GI24_DALPE|nr:hypothetical protein DPEC_G00166780 [Dallia pectoralis]